MINAQQWAENWVNGMNNAGEKMRRGAQAVTEAPSLRAVDAVNKMRANWIAAIDSGYWTGRMSSVTLDQWRNAYINKGIERIANGVAGARGKVQSYATRAIPIMTNLQNQIRQMPNATNQDAEARVLAWMRGMRAASDQLRG